MTSVSIANTSNFLRIRLRSHPLAEYLSKAYSSAELVSAINEKVRDFDGHIEKATEIYLLLFAIFSKNDELALDQNTSLALTNSNIPWIKELVLLNAAEKFLRPTTAYESFHFFPRPIAPPKTDTTTHFTKTFEQSHQ
ncbi:hypothetical protein [Herbaspirillum sp. meg3]|uniref:hypothetical protein n=1 Tax=Herbaspirillum sp. meg3 TaxID=2025949 RepID=UPI0012FD5240|nr:hypothetical protein [Herbaspirillum sp. meg3]